MAMTDTFRRREKSYEAKYKLEEEQRFKIASRRNRLLGLWAAEQMGLARPEGDAYARDVVAVDLNEPGVGDVVAKVVKDLHRHGVHVAEAEVRRRLDEFQAVATKEVQAEYPKPLGPDHDRVGDV